MRRRLIIIEISLWFNWTNEIFVAYRDILTYQPSHEALSWQSWPDFAIEHVRIDSSSTRWPSDIESFTATLVGYGKLISLHTKKSIRNRVLRNKSRG